VPAAQFVHSLFPAADIVPTGHDLQLVAPLKAWYVPAEQLSQVLFAASAWNEPVAHKVHPAAPALEYLPAAQGEHAPAPMIDL